jgi:hypothetical protein
LLPTATDDWTFFFQVVIRGGSDLAGMLRPKNKKRTVIWPAMFFSGFKLQPEKITTEKKGTVELSDRPFFSGGFKLQPEKIMTGKKRCSHLADGGDSDLVGTLQLEKKRTVVWPAMFFSGFKLQPEKIMTKKKRYSRLANLFFRS